MIKDEKGSVSVTGILGIVIMLFFLGMSLDAGLYIGRHRSLQQAVDAANAEVDAMLPYYLYSEDGGAHFRKIVTDMMDKKGLKYGELRLSMNRSLGYRGGTGYVKTQIHVYTRYQCKLAGIMGFWCNFPLRIDSEVKRELWVSGVPDPFEGHLVEVWEEEEEDDEE